MSGEPDVIHSKAYMEIVRDVLKEEAEQNPVAAALGGKRAISKKKLSTRQKSPRRKSSRSRSSRSIHKRRSASRSRSKRRRSQRL